MLPEVGRCNRSLLLIAATSVSWICPSTFDTTALFFITGLQVYRYWNVHFSKAESKIWLFEVIWEVETEKLMDIPGPLDRKQDQIIERVLGEVAVVCATGWGTTKILSVRWQ